MQLSMVKGYNVLQLREGNEYTVLGLFHKLKIVDCSILKTIKYLIWWVQPRMYSSNTYWLYTEKNFRSQ